MKNNIKNNVKNNNKDINKLMAREGINNLDYLINSVFFSVLVYFLVRFIVEKV